MQRLMCPVCSRRRELVDYPVYVGHMGYVQYYRMRTCYECRLTLEATIECGAAEAGSSYEQLEFLVAKDLEARP